LDADRLSVRNLDQAEDFITSYGYDWNDEEDQRVLFSFYRQAVAFLKDQWGDEEDFVIPEELWDPQKLGDIRNLLISASRGKPEGANLRQWSCAILKVMHIIAHLQNDLYSFFQTDIRKQILSPIKDHVFSDPVSHTHTLKFEGGTEKIRLSKFELKPKKNQGSAVVKLLAKKRLVALNILDRIGVRFVTKNTFDIFRTIRFLVDRGLVSYPHAIANESANMVYPIGMFLETMDALRSSNPTAEASEIAEALEKKLADQTEKPDFLLKGNMFTSPDYKFIKFISRRLVQVKMDINGKPQKIRFFYPFEIQIMDYDTYTNNMRGPLSHAEYKKRQNRAARTRLFGTS